MDCRVKPGNDGCCWSAVDPRSFFCNPPGNAVEEGAMVRAVHVSRWLVCALAVLWSAGALAQDAAPTFKGKTVDIYTGYTVGGGYDLYTRLLARHIGKHLPGTPTVVPKNMEGAASIRFANWLYSVAPKDGTAFGTIGRGTALDPLLGQPGAQFDGTKFNWIGSANDEVSVCVAWHTTGFTTFDDMLRRELLIGGTGPGDDTVQFGKVLAGVLGARLKIIAGYPGGNDAVLAMERGELQGRCGWSYSSVKAAHPDWLAQKKIAILVQFALAKHAELPDVPLVIDLAKTEEQRKLLKFVFARQVMGRPFLAPPGVPPATVAALRRAFMATMADPEFLADAERSKIEITPVAGERIQELVAELYKTPPELTKRLADMLR
jgi:tripartite-type tricarboxylate transporter receptor subunit TctC